MPQPKQTADLIFSLRALTYRLRQLTKERQGYSKAKHRELAKLLREGQEGLARIKAEDVIANDNLIIALEILELHCERLHVRANLLDHLVAQKGVRGKHAPKRRPVTPQHRVSQRQQPHARTSSSSSQSGGWSIGKLFGFGGPPPPPQAEQPAKPEPEPESPNDSPSQPAESQEDKPSQPAPHERERERDVYIDPDLDRDAAAIFYSYARIPRDIPGLLELRAKLVHRWGNDFALKAQDGDPSIVEVPRDLTERLRLDKPPDSLIDSYLREIARSYKIPFRGETWESEEEVEGEGSGAKEDGGKKSPSSGAGKDSSSSHSGAASRKSASPKDGIPEVDELAKRFAALKK